MRFFDNNAINRVYIHASLQMLAEAMGGVFVFAFLLKAGFQVAIVFCTLAAWSLCRLTIRQLVVPAVKRFGLRNCLIFGILLDACGFMIMSQITQPSWLLVFYVACASLGSCFYWSSFHTLISILGDAEKRGAQESFKQAIAAVISIVGPLLGAFLITHFGAFPAFAMAAICQTLSIITLFGIPNVTIINHATIEKTSAKNVWWIYYADGLCTAAYYYIWMIALFVVLGQSFSAYGLVLALGGLVGAIMSLGVGRLIDLGHLAHARKIGSLAMAVSLALKAFGYQIPWLAVVASAAGAVAMPLYGSVMMSRVYNLAQKSACPLRFQVIGEGAWDLGVSTVSLAGAGLAYFGFGFFWPIVIGLIGCALSYVTLAEKRVSAAA
jgi:MFS transporter, DHA1 family, inner membrane transport protein